MTSLKNVRNEKFLDFYDIFQNVIVLSVPVQILIKNNNNYNTFPMLKQPQKPKVSHPTLPIIDTSNINQTIIINNPNFNINYIDNANYQTLTKMNGTKGNLRDNSEQKLSSRGIDAWNLNKNLKEFSETRQLGFFKGGPAKTRSNVDLQQSPYLTHKIKTQDIRPLGKINLQAPSNKTISTIKYETITTARETSLGTIHQTTDANQESKTSFRKRKFESKHKNHKSNLDATTTLFQPYLKAAMQTNQYGKDRTAPKTDRKIQPITLNTRRNKFIELDTPTLVIKQSKTSRPQNQQQLLSQTQQVAQDSPRPLKPRPNNPIQKSIQKISKHFLSNLDSYLTFSTQPTIPSSKIQLYTSVMQQPVTHAQSGVQYKSTSVGEKVEGYEFGFEDERGRVRPKTPYKRKKMYEEM